MDEGDDARLSECNKYLWGKPHGYIADTTEFFCGTM